MRSRAAQYKRGAPAPARLPVAASNAAALPEIGGDARRQLVVDLLVQVLERRAHVEAVGEAPRVAPRDREVEHPEVTYGLRRGALPPLQVIHVEPEDTDAEGLTDAREMLMYHTSPTNTDTDLDGLSDYAEVITYRTDPNNADTNRPTVTILFPAPGARRVWVP